MVTAVRIRLGRVMRRGMMLCIPMDHGVSDGPVKGLEDPRSVIDSCDGQGLTCVVVNKGVLKSLRRPPRAGVFVHFSSSTSLSSSPNRKMLTGTVEEAVRLGADGVSLHVNVGGREEPEMLEQLGEVAGECHAWGMPLLAMMYPRGENVKDAHDPDTVAHAARIGAECGADIVKTVYTGDAGSFSRVVRCTPVPVVVAGGPRAGTDAALLGMTEDAVGAGAAGVTYGRNVFAHESPREMVRALASVVFRKKTAAEAAADLERSLGAAQGGGAAQGAARDGGAALQ